MQGPGAAGPCSTIKRYKQRSYVSSTLKWGAVCPGCNIGRKYPNSFIGKRVVEHWEKGCTVHEAHKEIFRGKDKVSKKT